MRFFRRHPAAGFTLVEMAIVLVVVGILIAVVSPKIKSASPAATAVGLYEFATSAVYGWRLVSNACSTTTDVTASGLPSAGASATNSLNLAIAGTGVTAAYSTCFNSTQIAPLRKKVSGAAGAYTVQGYTVSWGGVTGATGANTGPISVDFANVAPTVALVLYQRYSSVAGASTASSFPTAADSTDPVIQFPATAAGSPISSLHILIN